MNSLFNTKPICTSADGKGKLIKTTFKQIIDIADSTDSELKTPSEQIEIDKDKVVEIYNCYKKNSSFFLSKIVITIGRLTHDDKNTYFLIDGQHRMKAIKKLIKNDNINDDIVISFQNLKSNTDITSLFMELNKDSEKNLYIVQKEMKDVMKLIELKRLMSNKWAGCYAEKKLEISPFYTLTEFVEMLGKNNFFNKYYKKLDSKNIECEKSGEQYDKLITKISGDIINVIDAHHKKFFSQIGYLENTNSPSKFTPTEIKMINNKKNMMFSKHNNFISHLCMDHDPYHEYKSSRHTKSQRNKSWEKNNGGKTEHKCPVFRCDEILYKDIPFGFHLGHKKSLSNKGTNDDNFIPVCASCKSAMNTTNFDDYNESVKMEYIWKKYSTSKCQGKNCNKNIDQTNYKYIEFKNKKSTTYNIVCKKCHEKHMKELAESESESESESEYDSVSESESDS